ncbi:N-acyl homoserine lactonase family protein [Phytoactinopolyspora mesophila]|uniref:MBL fold metallo-hydrolase n=1 Tax=Phytoactinopolyspora mesophila TaxID=2650750 RepID=A0A7K3M8J0_9ACTN|nr:N-acyl homoserine lactonase family protein [Phytoactinopolyspora mesophila]NDL59307.1 MBL fold metallo-hydrolase [Phytoactinopolyspora mesophila]
MNSASPVSGVRVVSTGTVHMRPEHVGPTWKPMPLWLFTSKRWTGPRPINAFLIEHKAGLVLFDTGQDRASLLDPDYFPGRINKLVNARMGRFVAGPEDTLQAGLARFGYRPDDIDVVVLSHLHPDHIGGLPALRGAKIVVSGDEWATLSARLPESRGLYRSHIDLPGLRWQQVTPELLGAHAPASFSKGHDLFGDASMIVLPTPGHTPGSVSMLVRRSGQASLLLVGDLTYDADLLGACQLSGMGNRKRMRASIRQVNELRRAEPELIVLPAHDPSAAARLAADSGCDL